MWWIFLFLFLSSISGYIRGPALTLPLQRKLVQLTKTSPMNDPIHDKSDTFMKYLSQALEGGDIKSLDLVLMKDCKWSNPIVSNKAELLVALQQFSRFFPEPLLYSFQKDIINNKTICISYQLSFWYPLPWRPRIVIPAQANVTFSDDLSMVCSVTEIWSVSLLNIFWNQMVPRWWDVWHVFTSFVPECPPSIKIGKVGDVDIVQLPAGVVVETTWNGLAKYPGPPILTAPGFSLRGKLKSARPRREPYVATLPIEVETYRYTSASSREDTKRTIWRYRLPSSLQHKVLDKIDAGEITQITPDSLLNACSEDRKGALAGSEDKDANTTMMDVNTPEEVELQVGLDNLNIMKSVTRGVRRNSNFTLDREKAAEFESGESISFQYKLIPIRTFAVLTMRGEVNANSILKVLENMKAKLQNPNVRVGGKLLKLRKEFEGNIASNPLFTLQLWDLKTCFNSEAEPAMAVYEMQYGFPSTKLLVEIELY